MSSEKVLLSAKEVGERIGLHPRTILNMAKAGRIPRIKIARQVVRFDIDEVVEALKKGQKKK